MPLTYHAKDDNYGGPRKRRPPGVISVINPKATHGKRGFDDKNQCIAHADKHSPGPYGIGEWPTPWGVEYEWFYPSLES